MLFLLIVFDAIRVVFEQHNKATLRAGELIRNEHGECIRNVGGEFMIAALKAFDFRIVHGIFVWLVGLLERFFGFRECV